MVTKFNIKWAGLVLTVSMFISTALQAELMMSVDHNPVVMNESFALTLTSNESVDDDPDFSWIDREFEVVSRQQSSNYQMINGDVSRSINWTMTLLARRSGTFTVPPIRVDDQESNTIVLVVKEGTVSSPSQDDATNSQGLFLQVEAETGALYVQQQMLYTIKLFLSHDTGMTIGNGSSLSEPKLASGDAVIKRLGEDSNYQTVLNGKRYSVIERRYAIYPQQSGVLTINPVMFDGRMVEAANRARSIFDSLQQRSRIKRVASNNIVREVKAIPAEYQGRQWLPAKSVQLLEEWPEQQGMIVGEPVTRTVALLVDGITSAQLPTIKQNYPSGLKSYPDQPVLKETASEQGLTSLRQEKIALVASAAGKLVLPAIELSWWNTETGTQEIARLPARQISVTVAPGTGIKSEPGNHVDEKHSETTQVESQPEVTASSVDSEAREQRWIMLAIALASGWIITLLIWWWSSRQRGKEEKTKIAVAVETKKMVANSVKLACKNNDAEAAKNALIEWARNHWPDSPPSNLGGIAKQIDGELADTINKLSDALYSDGSVEWTGAALWHDFKNQQSENNRSEENGEDLVPIFRHQ